MNQTIRITCQIVLIASLLGCTEEPPGLIAEGAQLELVSDQFEFTEGPATAPGGDVYFTDQPNNRIHRWNAATGEITVYMEPAGRANGLYWDNQGNLLAAADEKFELWRIHPDREVEVLTDSYQGAHLNGPNDMWVHPDGTIYFTDPYYQRPYWERQEKEIEAEQVYRIPPSGGAPLLAATGLVQPNGIIGTPDGKNLYVADIGNSMTYRYDILDDRTLENPTLLITQGSDGMTLDEQGNLYLTGRGVDVYSPQGKHLLHIDVPESWTANITFGGTEGKTLFITAMDSVYTLEMNVAGMYWQPN
ncbi:SMP-30/gluconolactonase/LRE family protein [Robiginitalea sp. SC105]|uniref:SMP-30/gluconolactonase/LRE family protein n=1 Tax=Robiginitalea sp. SC105 TaxID=2762332 RepID=UPI00163982BF|nr:SMP-30/gluconolactonase/LRE family protein [Robiginitalea sp. SC105]MBC2839972.1 SMP-30/gluconolactonase/LRE family protein [Robiginitalea sp. SC105]